MAKSDLQRLQAELDALRADFATLEKRSVTLERTLQDLRDLREPEEEPTDPKPEPAPIPPAPSKSPTPTFPEPSPKNPPPSTLTELEVGQIWLVRFGAVLLLAGLVFLGHYAYQNWIKDVGPLARWTVLFVLGLGLTVAGDRVSRRPLLRRWGQSLAASGLGFLFFLSYAAYHVAPLQFVTSPLLGALLNLAGAGAILALALRRDSSLLATSGTALSLLTLILNSEWGPIGPPSETDLSPLFLPVSLFGLAVTATVFRHQKGWWLPATLTTSGAALILYTSPNPPPFSWPILLTTCLYWLALSAATFRRLGPLSSAPLAESKAHRGFGPAFLFGGVLLLVFVTTMGLEGRNDGTDLHGLPVALLGGVFLGSFFPSADRFRPLHGVLAGLALTVFLFCAFDGIALVTGLALQALLYGVLHASFPSRGLRWAAGIASILVPLSINPLLGRTVTLWDLAPAIAILAVTSVFLEKPASTGRHFATWLVTFCAAGLIAHALPNHDATYGLLPGLPLLALLTLAPTLFRSAAASHFILRCFALSFSLLALIFLTSVSRVHLLSPAPFGTLIAAFILTNLAAFCAPDRRLHQALHIIVALLLPAATLVVFQHYQLWPYFVPAAAVIGIHLVALGLWRRLPIYRAIGLTIFFIGVARLVITDVWQFQSLHRVLAFIGLGIALLLAGFLYQKIGSSLKPDQQCNP